MLGAGSVARLLAGGLAIVAIAGAAATVDNPPTPGGDGRSGTGGDGGSLPAGQVNASTSPASGAPTLPEYLLPVLVALVALAVAWYLVFHRRELVRTIAVGLAVGALAIAAAAVLTELAGLFDLADGASEGILPFGEGTPGTDGDGDADRGPVPTGYLLVLLSIAAGVFVGALVLSDGENRGSGDEEGGGGTGLEPATAAVGAAAGRAADRLEEGGEFDNEVYRAWAEMTRPLDVDRPAATTPDEFARAAVDAGLAADDVAELTRLFEEVRYGGRETTPAVETRAISVLERIESTYADGGEAR